jgi:3,4-dihydroxy 2-butanone 4-phosphate synthase / GTP cyclohydrolase II
MSALQIALEALRQGRMVILTGDKEDEDQGVLLVAAEYATPAVISFMAEFGRGLICLPMTGEQFDRLGLPPMTAQSPARRATAFTISIAARDGITTGISAFDRAHTIAVASNTDVHPKDIVSPGHVFPSRAVEGGVLKRADHKEGAVDLARLAGLRQAAVICQLMGDDGQIMRGEALAAFARIHDMPMLAIQDILRHRLATEQHVTEVASADLPSAFADGPLRVHAFRDALDGTEHLALVKHPLPAVPLVRVHSECLTGEAFGSLRCDCGPQLQDAIRRVAESDGGMVIYLRNQEGRGIGLANKIRAYALQDQGHDTLDANLALGFAGDARDYRAAAQILKHFGVTTLNLLSNNPAKRHGLEALGLAVATQQPLHIEANPFNAFYLETKRARFGHTLQHQRGN